MDFILWSLVVLLVFIVVIVALLDADEVDSIEERRFIDPLFYRVDSSGNEVPLTVDEITQLGRR